MIIIEGIDGTGKTTLATKLRELGMNDVVYNCTSAQNFAEKYQSINLSSAENGVSDRSFISEMAKGKIVRGVCRLSTKEFENLLKLYASFGTLVVYLKADKQTLLERRKNDKEDTEMLKTCFERVSEKYCAILEKTKKHMPVFEFDTSKTSTKQIVCCLKRLGAVKCNKQNLKNSVN